MSLKHFFSLKFIFLVFVWYWGNISNKICHISSYHRRYHTNNWKKYNLLKILVKYNDWTFAMLIKKNKSTKPQCIFYWAKIPLPLSCLILILKSRHFRNFHKKYYFTFFYQYRTEELKQAVSPVVKNAPIESIQIVVPTSVQVEIYSKIKLIFWHIWIYMLYLCMSLCKPKWVFG